MPLGGATRAFKAVFCARLRGIRGSFWGGVEVCSVFWRRVLVRPVGRNRERARESGTT